MVDVEIIPPKPLQFIVTIDLHYKYTFIHNFAIMFYTHIFVVHQNNKFMIIFYK
jgi:hypothetical protein